jgi:two-component system nitrogen regulation sensor histidine kinase NtrY
MVINISSKSPQEAYPADDWRDRQRLGLGRFAAPRLSRQGVWARTGLLVHVALVLSCLVAGIVTYATLTEVPTLESDPEALFWLLNIDGALLLCMVAAIAYQGVKLYHRRRRGVAGSRLQLRLVAVFSILAILPAILVAFFSALFFNFGIETWFSDRVRTAVDGSLTVARAYLEEHQRAIRADTLAMASDLNREALRLADNKARLNQFVRAVSAARGLSEAIVFDGNGRLLARSALAFSLVFEPVSSAQLQSANAGEVVQIKAETDDRVRALVKLDNYIDTYLYVGRIVDPDVVARLRLTEQAVEAYRALEGRRTDFQLTTSFIFLLVSVLILLAAIWAGLAVASRVSRPLASLITAAERLGAGDFTVRVGLQDPTDEIGRLGLTFNRMAHHLHAQRADLVDANRLLDSRRQFTEAVLSGVSAGVMGLTADGDINLPNRSAAELLGTNVARLQGQSIVSLWPEVGALMEQARQKPGREVRGEVAFTRADSNRCFLVRISGQITADDDDTAAGFVMTFDDITELLIAQRQAAWADVARRIAHEIKNPLTPIQLAAERLHRRFLPRIDDDKSIFESCVETIVRKVDDMRRMVDEFSSFARMPSARMEAVDLVRICLQSVTLFQSDREGTRVRFEAALDRLHMQADGAQLERALINLIRNADHAIKARRSDQYADESTSMGEIAVSLTVADAQAIVAVEDNGIGLPTQDRHLLVEPYVTNRAKGTGLGLAIVKKILEDHRGTLELTDRPGGQGARVVLNIPITTVITDTETDAAAAPPSISYPSPLPQ